MSLPDSQNPHSPLYKFIDTQPLSHFPNNPDYSPSHFTTRQFVPQSITNTLPIVVTKHDHDLKNGQALRATKFYGLPFANATGMEQLNNQLYYVRLATHDTFQLADRNTNPIDGRNFTPYIQGGEFTLVGVDLLVVNPQHFPPPGIPVPP